MKEQVKPSISQNDIVDAISKMVNRKEYPNVLVTSVKGFSLIRKFPGYSPNFLYGKQIIENEMGHIEGLVVQVIIDLPHDIMYIGYDKS